MPGRERDATLHTHTHTKFSEGESFKAKPCNLAQYNQYAPHYYRATIQVFVLVEQPWAEIISAGKK